MSAAAQKKYWSRVGIVYSETAGLSLESKHIAFYLAAQLTSKGYCEVVLIGHSSDGLPSQTISSERIIYKNLRDSKSREVPGSSISFKHWDSASECDLIIVTVNSEDTASVSKKLCDLFVCKKEDKRDKIPVFSIQRGVRNSQALKENVDDQLNRTVILECSLNFTVIPNSAGVLSTSTYTPRILIERLSKDNEKFCMGPVNLLESCDVFEFYYDKNISQSTWGVLLFDNLSALNTITSGTLKSTLNNRANRRVLSTMMRESRLALLRGSGGQGWSPSFSLVFSRTSVMTPWLWEMILLLPSPFFAIASMLFISSIDLGKGSHYRWDLENGRKTTIRSHLGSIVETGMKYSQDVTILNEVLIKIIAYEDRVHPSSVLDISNANADMAEIVSTFEYNHSKAGKRGGDQEFLYYVSRIVIFLLFIPVAFFLFYLE